MDLLSWISKHVHRSAQAQPAKLAQQRTATNDGQAAAGSIKQQPQAAISDMAMAEPSKKRCRTVEYEKASFNRTSVANPQSREATVWANLKGNSPSVQALQKEFMETFQKHGFGCVEGSK